MPSITDYTKPIVDFSNFHISQLKDALSFGGTMLLVGALTVFAVLCILWICLLVFKFFAHDIPKKAAAKKELELNTMHVVDEDTSSETDDAEIIAVITAAIAMAESENSDMKFRVVSFKRV